MMENKNIYNINKYDKQVEKKYLYNIDKFIYKYLYIIHKCKKIKKIETIVMLLISKHQSPTTTPFCWLR